MKDGLKDQPRRFLVAGREICDYGKVELAPGEMLSVVPEGCGECDVTATEWGLYVAPSLNGRLAASGYRTALVENSVGKLFLNAVHNSKFDLFKKYLQEQEARVVRWIDELGPILDPNGEEIEL